MFPTGAILTISSGATIHTVKKLLLILLLLALPFQYSWAAAAAYCQHEKTHISHFGHHSHQHAAHAVKLAEKADEKSKLPALDNDCGYCHLSCQVTPTSVAPDLAVPPAVGPPVLRMILFSSYFPEGPKRPDRTLVA